MTVMTFSHDDIRDRLVDYLYGELDGDARAAFLAHLEGCAGCRADVSGAEQARAVARTVVRAPLADAVPERVRARALQAARAAAQKPAPDPADARAAAVASAGWFGRIRRRWTWTFPTFATVAAMAAFLLVRATIFREAKRPLGENPTGALSKAPPPAGLAAPAAAPAPVERNAVPVAAAPVAPPAAAEPAVPAKPSGGKHKAGVRGGRGAATAGAPPRSDDGFAGADQPLSAKAGGSGLGGLSSSSRIAGGAVAPAAKASPRGETEGAADEAFAERSREAKNAARTVRLKAATPAPAAPARAYAPPPPPAPAAAPFPSPAKRSLDDLDLDSLSSTKHAARRDVEEAPMADDVEAAPEDRKAAKKEAPKGKANTKDKAPLAAPAAPLDAASGSAAPPDPVLALTRYAQDAMNARRWSDAIVTYRELLRRYPSHASAPEWRKRLAAAQAALAADTGQFASPPPPRPGQ